MTSKDNFFARQNEIVKETWAKDIINGKYGENVKFLSYDGWNNQFKLDKENHILHVRAEDDIENTFKKTYYALKVLQNNFDYDYIFRTNTSTYINVQLAIEFINSLESDDILYTSEMISLIENTVPNPLDIYGRGNGLILSRKLIDIILKEGISFIYQNYCDDIIIGNILNSFFIKNGENYLDHIKSYCHGWYKCVLHDVKNNHQLCKFSNTDNSFDFLSKFITIQVKHYIDRSLEENNYKELHKIFQDNDLNNIDELIKINYEYSKNPSIFIGSILGYMNYNNWLKYDKYKLYEIEANNKAADDKYINVFKNKPWL